MRRGPKGVSLRATGFALGSRVKPENDDEGAPSRVRKNSLDEMTVGRTEVPLDKRRGGRKKRKR